MKSNDSTKCGIYTRIATLEPGETASMAERLIQGATSAEDLTKIFEQMRNSANPAVRYAKAANPGSVYVVEGGDFRTKNYDIVAVMAITRIK